MVRYRYRTCAILGHWRSSYRQAAADAVKARQAIWSDDGEGIDWLVPGRIEEQQRVAA